MVYFCYEIVSIPEIVTIHFAQIPELGLMELNSFQYIDEPDLQNYPFYHSTLQHTNALISEGKKNMDETIFVR